MHYAKLAILSRYDVRIYTEDDTAADAAAANAILWPSLCAARVHRRDIVDTLDIRDYSTTDRALHAAAHRADGLGEEEAAHVVALLPS